MNGLSLHVLEAGRSDAPVLLLLHGFPELAFSWRKIMLPLADEGYRVLAPDQRGYGATTGWQHGFDIDIRPFGIFNLVRDMVALLGRLNVPRVECLIGHDFGAMVAPYGCLLRPDLFPKLVMMSAPFPGPPNFAQKAPGSDIHADLLALDPPRKHYQWYYSTDAAASDMLHAPQGFKHFLRGYFHMKSGDWPGNHPFELEAWAAPELAKMPKYYIMQAGSGMAETVADETPDSQCHWLSGDELEVYAEAFTRTGLQAALNWYRCGTSAWQEEELKLLGGRQIDVPAAFIAGARDWGIHQRPGALCAMQHKACSDFRSLTLIEGAGHWVQQEKPNETVRALLPFLAE